MNYRLAFVSICALAFTVKVFAGGPPTGPNNPPTCAELEPAQGNHADNCAEDGGLGGCNGIIGDELPDSTQIAAPQQFCPGHNVKGCDRVYADIFKQCYCNTVPINVIVNGQLVVVPPGFGGVDTTWWNTSNCDPNLPIGSACDPYGCHWNIPYYDGNPFPNPNICIPATASHSNLLDCRPWLCGDGIMDSGEQCDDGNEVDTDSCRNNCTTPRCGDGIIDQGEECDDQNAVSGDGCSSTCKEEHNDFNCYEAKRQSITYGPVTFKDRFGQQTVQVRRPERLCAPANVNATDPSAPNDPNHYALYRLSGGVSGTANGQLVTGGLFDSLTLNVKVAEFLAASTAKDPNGPTAPNLLTNPSDYLICHKVSVTAGTKPNVPGLITVGDQFNLNQLLKLTRPRWLCVPANVNNTTPGAETHTKGLVCYRISNRKLSPPLFPVINNALFGPRAIKLDAHDEVCVSVDLN